MKVEQLDRRILQTIFLQLQKHFALLRYLLFSSIATTPINDTPNNNSASSPPTNRNPTLTALSISCADEPPVRLSTPEGTVGSLRAKTDNFTNANFQSSPNTRKAPPTKVQNLTSRISKLEKLIADKIATYTSINAGIHSQNFFLCDKIRQLEASKSHAIIWKFPSVKFVFDSAKLARQSSDPLVEPVTGFFRSPTLRTQPHGNNFFCQILPLLYWTRYGQECINSIHPFPWCLRQPAPMALVEAHQHWNL